MRACVPVIFWVQETTASGVRGAVESSAGRDGVGLAELLSGAAGAFLVFVLGVVWQGVRDVRRRKRERVALMTLMHHEIMHNERILERVGASEYPSGADELAVLHDDAWRENRARIAQLEDERAVEYLGMYYTSIGNLISAERLSRETNDNAPVVEIKEMFTATLNNLGPLARYVCERQTGAKRVWSNGMLVVSGKHKPVQEVEDNWRRRELEPVPDDPKDGDED